MKCSAFLALVVSALVLAGSAGAGVNVWFVADGKPVSVPRNGTTLQKAVQQLLAGPTAAERSRGIHSAVPRATPLRSVTVTHRVVTVDLGARFAAGSDRALLQAARRPARSHAARHPGRPRRQGARRGRRADRPLPRLRPQQAGSRPRSSRPRSTSSTTRDIQQRLIDLGFMAPSGLTGTVDTQTSTAVIGFQKWANLPRDGVLGASTVDVLERATRPEPRMRMPGRRIEVQLRRQLALLIEDNRVVRAVHISSGSGGRTPTGSFRVYRKERYSWSVPFKVWLPWASYFTGGIAFHEYPSVPTYAASHGCVRVNYYDAQMLFGFAEQGTPVNVFDEAYL